MSPEPRKDPGVQRGEAGTVAVTVSGRDGQPPSYQADLSGPPLKVRVGGLSITYVDRFGHETEAVRDMSFEIADKPGTGEVVVFLGPSGCGKSTILKAVAGLLPATKGEIRVDGRLVDGVGRDRGMVFQAYTSFGWLTVRENVEYGLRLQGVARAQRRALSDKYLKEVGLDEFADHYPKQLSGGMKQRVAIARVLANEANILLMDEPFGALDALTREQLQEELLQIWERTQVTVIFVTHSVEEATFLAGRVVVMTAGPGRIESDNRITLARPRDVSAPDFNDVRRELTRHLTSHVQRRELRTAA